MPLAFVLISTESGTEREVLENIKKIPEVKNAHMVYGLHDIIAMIEANTMEGLREITTKKIRQLDRIRSTMTLIVKDNPPHA